MADVLSNFSSVLTAVLLIVSVVAAIYGALNREALKTLRDTNGDLLQRVGVLEAEVTRYKAENAALVAENATLRSVVTGEDRLTAIEAMMTRHHNELLAAMKERP